MRVKSVLHLARNIGHHRFGQCTIVEIARYSFLLMMVLPLMRVSSFIVLYAKASHDTGTLPLKCYTRSSAKKHLFKMRFRSFGI